MLSLPTAAPLLLAAAAEDAAPAVSDTRLIVAAVVGIAVIVALIVWVKLHPFLALMLGAGVLAVAAGLPYVDAFTSFTAGLGTTVAGVGILIALGAIIGKMLIDSGGADQIVDSILARTPVQRLPWAMAFAAFIIGIPLFFEVGVVLLIPVVMLVARRSKVSMIVVGIPALAGLSALHGLVPPHPGPLIAIDALGADLGLTLGLGLLVSIPTVAIAGPLLAKPMARWVPLDPPTEILGASDRADDARRPSFATALTVVLLPVVLMLARTLAETVGFEDSGFGQVLDFVGTPLVALLITALVSLVLLGTRQGRDRSMVSKLVDSSFAPIASILLIVGAGGGFKQTLVDSGVGDVIAKGLANAPISPLLAAWLVAVLIRVATGSATVATVTAAGIVAPLAEGLSPTHVALMVLAIGAGSVFLSHVNDAGFWLVKEYFKMTVGQTFKTWSLMECVLSVTALVVVLLLSLVI
ncbi:MULTISPECIES: GntP family permease [unclassified Cellulomonas]|jgi:gluconate:H+ symporter, GntP family|uniref:GntP family permease n=1 Tax=unclassified Cellulomonas TaxID=2620175 RepID=UPI001C2F7BA4|nr:MULTISPECIES: gluconate:H+ symporter [unclassified Cellulomonas]MBW0256304.1 GntP family permease [Cellulomonas sp. PS-H5]